MSSRSVPKSLGEGTVVACARHHTPRTLILSWVCERVHFVDERRRRSDPPGRVSFRAR